MLHGVLLFCLNSYFRCQNHKSHNSTRLNIKRSAGCKDNSFVIWEKTGAAVQTAVLPITWHLTQQLLAKAGPLFTHHYTSAVHKHRKTQDTQCDTRTQHSHWKDNRLSAACWCCSCFHVRIELYEWLQTGSVGVCSYPVSHNHNWWCIYRGVMSWQPEIILLNR